MTDHTTDSNSNAPADDHLNDPALTDQRRHRRRTQLHANVIVGVIIGIFFLGASLPGLVSLASLPTSALSDHVYPAMGVGTLIFFGLICFVYVGRELTRLGALPDTEPDDDVGPGGDHGDA